MKYIAIGTVLLILAAQDARTKTVSIGWVLVLAVCSIGVRTEYGMEILTGCMPGVLLVLLAAVTSEQVGIGDGLILIALGSGIGLEHTIIIFLFGSLFLSSFLAMVLVLKKESASTRYPMIPCLFLGYITDVWLMGSFQMSL